jgi:hypothetical protein
VGCVRVLSAFSAYLRRSVPLAAVFPRLASAVDGRRWPISATIVLVSLLPVIKHQLYLFIECKGRILHVDEFIHGSIQILACFVVYLWAHLDYTYG